MKAQLQDPEEINLVLLAQKYSDEDAAIKLLEQMRWPKGVRCPKCDCDDVYKITAKRESKSPARKGLYCCAACRKQFTVKVGTIFEDSHLPVSKWLMALFIMCSSKKSVSAHQLHRMLGVTYKTAWFMAHRIRYAMTDTSKAPPLSGTVEVDETFVGGKCNVKQNYLRKTPVVALIERNGNMRSAVVANVTQKNLGRILNECVSKGAVLNTDEHLAYNQVGKQFKRHDKVVHSRYEYARKLPDGSVAHINTCESFFSLLKRGVHGSWHHVSGEHLPKYAGEFAFRWNFRKVSDGERMVAAVATTEGKRLTYQQAI